MCSGSRPARAVLAIAVLASAACSGRAAGEGAAARVARDDGLSRGARVLRVCADPNNLPFSDSSGAGFENALAELIARDLGRQVAYTWHPQRRGFVRNTLRAGACDLVMGVPAGYELAATTRPYYRSTYVFVTRSDRHLRFDSLDDPRLRTMRIGVPVVGDDYANTPGAAAMARRGNARQLVGFSVYGNYDQPHPPSRLVEAVARGDIDVAIAWGPLAGYFAGRLPVPLDIVPLAPSFDPPDTPFVFDIAMATRRGDDTLRQAVEAALERHRGAVDSILGAFGVPLLPLDSGPLAWAAGEEERP